MARVYHLDQAQALFQFLIPAFLHLDMDRSLLRSPLIGSAALSMLIGGSR